MGKGKQIIVVVHNVMWATFFKPLLARKIQQTLLECLLAVLLLKRTSKVANIFYTRCTISRKVHMISFVVLRKISTA